MTVSELMIQNRRTLHMRLNTRFISIKSTLTLSKIKIPPHHGGTRRPGNFRDKPQYGQKTSYV